MQNYKRRDIDIILRRNGFNPARQKGSHLIYKNDKGEHITIGLCHCNGLIMHKMIKKHDLIV